MSSPVWNAQRRAEVIDAILNTIGHLGWPESVGSDFRDLVSRKGLPRPPAGGTVRGYCAGLTGVELVKLSDALDLRLEQMLDDEIVRGGAR
jgi:hypothetical protein